MTDDNKQCRITPCRRSKQVIYFILQELLVFFNGKVPLQDVELAVARYSRKYGFTKIEHTRSPHFYLKITLW